MSYLLTLILLPIAIWLDHAALALILGIVLAYLVPIPDGFITKKYGTKVLQTGIVFLGGSISVSQVTEITKEFLPWVSLYVLVTFILVLALGKIIGVGKKQTYLIASGSAICGGSAMAAVAPIIKPKPKELLISLTIIFVLNAIAVVIFPLLGNWMDLSQEQFGSWAALAIHDTASVIGASSIMGDEALEVAATLKLGRTLWIVPLILFSAWYFREKSSAFGFPLFIIFFILAVFLNSFFSPSDEINNLLKNINKVCILTGLFCIGSQIDRKTLKEISFKPLLLAVFIWLLVIPSSFWLIS
ncbi:MAG: YeiH family protein [Gammaproteobacteria bacterium]